MARGMCEGATSVTLWTGASVDTTDASVAVILWLEFGDQRCVATNANLAETNCLLWTSEDAGLTPRHPARPAVQRSEVKRLRACAVPWPNGAVAGQNRLHPIMGPRESHP